MMFEQQAFNPMATSMDLSHALDELSKTMGIPSTNKSCDVTTASPLTPSFTVAQNDMYVPESGTPPDEWPRVNSRGPHPLVDLWTQSTDTTNINTSQAFVLNRGGDILVKVNKTNQISWVNVAKQIFRSPYVQCRETMQGMLFLGPTDVLWVPYIIY
jgi:hypothetical protein